MARGGIRKWADRETEVSARYESGETATSIAKDLGTSGGIITAMLRRNGVAVREGYWWRSLSEEAVDSLIEKYNSGLSVGDLAAEFSVTKSMVYARFKARDVPLRGGRQRKVLTSKEDLQTVVELYESGQTMKSIARRMGVNEITVRARLRSQGVVLRKLLHTQHWAWTGGRHIKNGYVEVVLSPDDPYIWMARLRRRIAEHRYVMAKHLGRCLESWEQVHHINGDKMDNRIENLQLRVGPHGNAVCLRCRDCGSRNVESVPLGEHD